MYCIFINCDSYGVDKHLNADKLFDVKLSSSKEKDTTTNVYLFFSHPEMFTTQGEKI